MTATGQERDSPSSSKGGRDPTQGQGSDTYPCNADYPNQGNSCCSYAGVQPLYPYQPRPGE